MTSTEHPAVPYVIPLPGRWISRALVILLAILLIADVWFQYLKFDGNRAPWNFDELFNVDEEQSLPTWFSAASMMFSAALLLAIAGRAKRERDSNAPYWYGLAIGFGFMSLDEIAGVHETINTYLDIPWTLPGAILAAVIGLLYVRFLLRLPRGTRWLFVAAGAAFVGGEMGVQFGINWWLFTHSMDSLAYNLLAAIDKGLKMGGIVLFVHALLSYMSAEQPPIPEIILAPQA